MKEFKENWMSYIALVAGILILLFQGMTTIEKRFVPRSEYDGFCREVNLVNQNTDKNMAEIKELQKEMRSDIKKLIERSIK